MMGYSCKVANCGTHKLDGFVTYCVPKAWKEFFQLLAAKKNIAELTNKNRRRIEAQELARIQLRKPPGLQAWSSALQILNVLQEVALEKNTTLMYLMAICVLLLNTASTVERGKAKSHVGDNWWKLFTRLLIAYINQNGKQTVWLLWGKRPRIIAMFSSFLTTRSTTLNQVSQNVVAMTTSTCHAKLFPGKFKINPQSLKAFG